MDYSKTKKIIDGIIKILSLISKFFGWKSSNKSENDATITNMKQDEQTNTDMLKKINENIKKKIISILVIISFVIISGCINLNFGVDNEDEKSTKKTDDTEILLANPLNVYKTTTNIIIGVATQNKRGKWVESKESVIIPIGWYIVSGYGIDESEDKETK